MSIFLTGATGLVGSAILRRLRELDRDVTALVRDPAKRAAVEATGATVLAGDITDRELVATAAAASTGVIHTASPGDASSAQVDRTFVQTVLEALDGTTIPFVHTGGVWVFGAGDDLTENSPLQLPAITAWRAPVESMVRSSPVRTTIIAPGIVYAADNAGIANVVRPDGSGTARLVGSGDQHWTTIDADDLADLYVRAVDAAQPDAYYLGVSGHNPTVREIAEAAAHGGTVVAETVEESRARLGELFADALLLDQQSHGSAAVADLGWSPQRPSLLDTLR